MKIKSRKFPQNPAQEITKAAWDAMPADKNRSWLVIDATDQPTEEKKAKPLDAEVKPSKKAEAKTESGI